MAPADPNPKPRVGRPVKLGYAERESWRARLGITDWRHGVHAVSMILGMPFVIAYCLVWVWVRDTVTPPR